MRMNTTFPHRLHHLPARTAALCSAALLLILWAPVSRAEDQPWKKVIAEGIDLFDEGDLAGAEATFRQVLQEDPENVLALYELAYTMKAAKQWQECIEFAKRGERHQHPYLGAALATLAGNCLDYSGKPKKAEKTFRRGLRKYGDSVHLSFNLGVTLLGLGKFQEAVPNFQDALRLRPTYASAMLYLGVAYRNVNLRTPALLANLRFLSLEPTSQRSTDAAGAIMHLLHVGVVQTSEKEISLTVDSSFSKGKDKGFHTIELMLPMLSASRFLEDNKEKSEASLSTEMLPSFIRLFEEVAQEDRRDPFLWDELLPPLSELESRGLLEPLGYLAFSLIDTPGAQ